MPPMLLSRDALLLLYSVMLLFLQSEFLSEMGVTFKSASWLSLAIASAAAALLGILASFAIQRYRIRQEMHNEIHEIM